MGVTVAVKALRVSMRNTKRSTSGCRTDPYGSTYMGAGAAKIFVRVSRKFPSWGKDGNLEGFRWLDLVNVAESIGQCCVIMSQCNVVRGCGPYDPCQ